MPQETKDITLLCYKVITSLNIPQKEKNQLIIHLFEMGFTKDLKERLIGYLDKEIKSSKDKIVRQKKKLSEVEKSVRQKLSTLENKTKEKLFLLEKNVLETIEVAIKEQNEERCKKILEALRRKVNYVLNLNFIPKLLKSKLFDNN